MDPALLKVAEAVSQSFISAGGGAILLVFVGRWLFSTYVEALKKNRELEKAANDTQIVGLTKLYYAVEALIKETKLEVSALKDRIHHVEKMFVEGISKMTRHSEQMDATTKAMEGYVAATNSRLKVVEVRSEQLIRVGKAMAARITKKGPLNGG